MKQPFSSSKQNDNIWHREWNCSKSHKHSFSPLKPHHECENIQNPILAHQNCCNFRPSHSQNKLQFSQQSEDSHGCASNKWFTSRASYRHIYISFGFSLLTNNVFRRTTQEQQNKVQALTVWWGRSDPWRPRHRCVTTRCGPGGGSPGVPASWRCWSRWSSAGCGSSPWNTRQKMQGEWWYQCRSDGFQLDRSNPWNADGRHSFTCTVFIVWLLHMTGMFDIFQLWTT